MTELNPKIVEQWERIKTLLEMTEQHVLKNAKGNASAGIRARKGLRQLKEEAGALVKLTIEETKRLKAEKAG
jgi:hypothetical protein